MTLQKWNSKTREYEPYTVPDEWNVKTFCANLDEMVNCPHCGKRLTYGECYTSREIHTKFGMGYAVCEQCYYGKEDWR